MQEEHWAGGALGRGCTSHPLIIILLSYERDSASSIVECITKSISSILSVETFSSTWLASGVNPVGLKLPSNIISYYATQRVLFM